MYNTAHFSRMPKSELPGTRMKKPQINAGTSLHGDIIPLFCNLVMPGQVDSNYMNGVIWMSNPIAPIMSQIKGSINVFFVPLRLIWQYTEEFFGENKTSSGPQTTVYNIPTSKINRSSSENYKVTVGSVAHYLHKPLYKGDAKEDSSGVDVSILKERAYWLVWSEYYRHQQVENPFICDKGGNGTAAYIGWLGEDRVFINHLPAKCLKDFDYFTTATISPNYGGEVLLPLGTLAPVITGAENTSLVSSGILKSDVQALKFRTKEINISSRENTVLLTDESEKLRSGAIMGDPGIANLYEVAPTNLYADLSQATAAKIDDLYTAMAAQAWYHNANYGSRYFEMIQIHYGVSNPDLVLQRPEHVSEFKFDIIVQDVVSMSGATNDTSTKLGTPGAYSKTYIQKRLYNHSFGEWGFVIGLFNTYHQRYYSAGIPREDLYSELFDFYFPEFANRGDDYIYKGEIYLGGTASSNKEAFGYQEAYADRRYYPATATGQLDAYCDASVNGKNPIGRWILDEKWNNRPTLSAEFLKEDRNAIASALVSGESGPDYIWHFNFEHTEILPMPAYSKPGVPSFGRGII